MESNETLRPDAAVEQPEKAPVTVCDVQFRSGSKNYFFDPGALTVRTGDDVVIETARGAEFGRCVRGNHTVNADEVVAPLRPVLRLATAQDKRTDADNRLREKHAFEVCQCKIEELGLEMQLVSAEYAFDGSKVLFFFTADGRVDFRELVKILASMLRTRIELRQIGVRDKAKMVGGLGICGRPFCCREFLDDFQPVSIKMAKTQNLSLNPTKISGTCGRLMCCLNYEQEAYEDLIKTSPKAESFVDTPDGRGTVTDVNLLRQSVKVRLEQQPDTIVCHKNCDICVLRNGKAKKTDAPIPDDLAPISGDPKRRAKQEAATLTTYLAPVVMKQNAEVLEEARTNAVEVEETEKKRRRRSGRNRSKSKGEARVEQKPAVSRPAQKPQKPAKAEQPKPPRAAEARPAEAKAEQRPPRAAEAKQTAPDAEGEKAKNAQRRRYHRRRKPGMQKPEG